MKILISAAEASSDAHGAALVRALRKLNADKEISFFGIGGDELKREGLQCVVDSKNLLVMGFLAVIAKLPKILKAHKEIVNAARIEKPALALVLDYPDFHFRLAKKLHKMGIPVFYYIPPKVWVWRKKRVYFLRKYFNKLFCILPFEKNFYGKFGVDAEYVGNPIVDELPLEVTRSEARKKLGLNAQERVLLLMPGSRPSELKVHLNVMLNAAKKAEKKLGHKIKILIPTLSTEDRDWIKDQIKNIEGLPEIKLLQKQSHLAMIAADAGVIKSGTSTLEAGLLKCPHIIIYRGAKITEFLFNLIVRYKGPVGLVNLLLKYELPKKENRLELPFKEFLMEDFNLENVSNEIVDLFNNKNRLDQLQESFLKLRNNVLIKTSPSEAVAQEVLNYLNAKSFEPVVAAPRSPHFFLVSFFWSFLNLVIRAVFLFFPKKTLEAKNVISIGNIEAGGTGKTPFVSWLANEAHKKGLSVCVLLRGYKRKVKNVVGIISPNQKEFKINELGDEATLIHQNAPHAWVGVHKNRFRSYQAVRSLHGKKFDLVLLDDGFQQFRIKKDIEILMRTSLNRFQTYFREFNWMSRFFDFMIWTKGRVRPNGYGIPIFELNYTMSKNLKGQNLYCVFGVAHFDGLLNWINMQNPTSLKVETFPDHHDYFNEEKKRIFNFATQNNYKIVLTGKDWVKWEKDFSHQDKENHFIVLEPDLKWMQGEEKCLQLLLAK